MSEELMKAFFERDLNEEEMEAVSKLLEASTEAAGCFDKLVSAHYESLGLPVPKKISGTGGAQFGWKTMLLGFTCGAGLAGLIYLRAKDEPAATAPGEAAIPAALPAQAASQLPEPIAVKTKVLYDEGQALAVKIELQNPRQLKVDVLDMAGRRVRRLAEGPYDPGVQKFVWDGLDAKGQTLSGQYRIVVDYGGGQMEKQVSILGRN